MTVTTCQQVVPTTLLQFLVTKLVTSCSNNLLRVCNSTSCWQQLVTCWWLNNLSTSCSNHLATICCHQACYKLFQQLVTSLQVHNLSTSCWQKLATSCWLNKLVATCSTSCYKLVKSTTCWQVVRFYVCSLTHGLSNISRSKFIAQNPVGIEHWWLKTCDWHYSRINSIRRIILFKVLRYWYGYRDFCVKSPFSFKPLSLVSQPFWKQKKISSPFLFSPLCWKSRSFICCKIAKYKNTYKKLTFMLI